MMLHENNILITFIAILSWLYLQSTSHALLHETLKPGQILYHSDQLCSPMYKFCLKFTALESDPKHTYLVILNTLTLTPTGYVDWIANRNDPIHNDSGVLTLNHSGALTITRQGGNLITLYSPVVPTYKNVAVTLLDCGNLILGQYDDRGFVKHVMWQSFDHPSNVLLPGMKLGANYKTNMSWSLVSLDFGADSASGSFELSWEPKKHQLIIKKGGKTYWTSGKLRKNRFFENIPKKIQRMYEYEIISNKDEESFSYKSKNDQSQWVLSGDGDVKDTGMEVTIAHASSCYHSFSTKKGCQIYEQPKCRHPHDQFKPIFGYFDNQSSPGAFSKEVKGIRLTQSDCMDFCWNSCSCVGFTTFFQNKTGCKHYYGAWVPIEKSDGLRINILIKSPGHNQGMKWIKTCVPTGMTVLLISLGIFCIWLRRRKVAAQEEKRRTLENDMLNIVVDRCNSFIEHQNQMMNGNDLRIFSCSSIMAATNNFSLENKLGAGGFGSVYKGLLPHGQEIAIKKLSKDSKQGVIEFENELTLISELQHTNIVQLLGCCIDGDERMLIYEYMPNKSLDFFLFDSTQSEKLDWRKRFNIIEGIAQGLLYLHKYSRLRVVHRDLKASNILLDANMNPKISDFGLAKILTQEESNLSTQRIVGTFGYMSPEYAMAGIFSTKSDVYAFGVLLLEIISGRRNSSFYDAEQPLNLVGHAWELWNKGKGLNLSHPNLPESFLHDKVLRCIHVGLLCVEERAVDRPTMSEIMSMLTSESAILPLPKRPAFYLERNLTEECSPVNHSETYSMNGLNISNLDER